MKVEFRPATLADVREFGRELPPCAARTWAGLIDGKVVALGGFGYLPNGGVIAFLDADDIVRDKARISLMKAARHVLKAARERGVSEITAMSQTEIEAADRFLRRLGFAPVASMPGAYVNRG